MRRASCDGSGYGVPLRYFGGDGKGVARCPFCKRKFVVRARRDDVPEGFGEHWYGNLPPHVSEVRDGR